MSPFSELCGGAPCQIWPVQTVRIARYAPLLEQTALKSAGLRDREGYQIGPRTFKCFSHGTILPKAVYVWYTVVLFVYVACRQWGFALALSERYQDVRLAFGGEE